MLANISDLVQDIPFQNLSDITFDDLDATGDSQPKWSKGQVSLSLYCVGIIFILD